MNKNSWNFDDLRNYKKVNQEAYDTHAVLYANNTTGYLQNHLMDDVSLFCQNLGGRRILDVGSGLGRDALFSNKMVLSLFVLVFLQQ